MARIKCAVGEVHSFTVVRRNHLWGNYDEVWIAGEKRVRRDGKLFAILAFTLFDYPCWMRAFEKVEVVRRMTDKEKEKKIDFLYRMQLSKIEWFSDAFMKRCFREGAAALEGFSDGKPKEGWSLDAA